jgi:uncharacterized membrane protein
VKRQTQLLAAAACGVVFVWGLRRAFRGRRIRTLPYGQGIKIKRAVTVNREAADLYRRWRDLKSLPQLFDHKLSVEEIDDRRSSWTMNLPGGLRLKWTAEIITDRENEMIGWRTLDGADLPNAGYVRFEQATGGRGTVVRLALQYNPPGGKVGAVLSTLISRRPGSTLEEALRRFKNIMEAGEIPVTQENVSRFDQVQVASEESFPASDAPAWTGTLGPS